MADLLPPQASDAANRLRENPKAFDRADNFCSGKRKGDSCTIEGSRLAGGGEGICENEINRSQYTIDLNCNRKASVSIDRDLPSGGFVADASLCRDVDPDKEKRWNCKPLVPTPADRFCRGKQPGDICTVELRYDGRAEQHAGVCKSMLEQEGFYYQGRRVASRMAVRCEAADSITRSYSAATWWQKLTQ